VSVKTGVTTIHIKVMNLAFDISRN